MTVEQAAELLQKIDDLTALLNVVGSNQLYGLFALIGVLLALTVAVIWRG